MGTESPQSIDGAKSSSGIISMIAGLSLALKFNSTTQTTYAIAIGLCDHQRTKLIETIQSCTAELSLPMSLAVMWLNIMGELRARRIMYRKDAAIRSEMDVGIHWSKDNANSNDLVEFDFNSLTRRLTVLGSEAAWDIHALEAQIEIASLVEDVSGRMPATASTEVQAAFRRRLRYATQLLKGLRHWNTYTQSRVHIQLQTVRRFSSLPEE